MFYLDIAEILSCIIFKGFSTDIESKLRDRLLLFVTADACAADITMEIEEDLAGSHLKDIEFCFSKGIYSFSGRGMNGYIDGDHAAGQIMPDINVAESFVRIVYSVMAVKKGGFLLHAAGAAGAIYTGPPGSGKTTSVRNMDSILGDDIIGMNEENGCWYAYATPFSGELGHMISSGSEAVKNIFLLDMEKRPAMNQEVYAAIMKNTIYFFNDHYGIEKIEECAARLSCSVQGHGYKNIR